MRKEHRWGEVFMEEKIPLPPPDAPFRDIKNLADILTDIAVLVKPYCPSLDVSTDLPEHHSQHGMSGRNVAVCCTAAATRLQTLKVP